MTQKPKSTKPKMRFRDGTGKFRRQQGTLIPEDLKPHPFEEPKLGHQQPLPEDRPADWPPTP